MHFVNIFWSCDVTVYHIYPSILKVVRIMATDVQMVYCHKNLLEP